MKNPDCRGSILILSLWILAILVLLSLGLGYSMSLDQRLVSYQRDRLMALHLARAGHLAAVAELERDPTPDLDGSADPLFHNPELFHEVPLGDGSYTIFASIREEGEVATTRYGVVDEERKISLNFASREVLLRLPEVTEEIADSILDWRDEDSFPHLLGAEEFYYHSLDPPYDPKNAPFELLPELLLVRGMTEEIFGGIEPFVTVYTDGKVNVNTAPKEVLVALGMSEGLAEKILKFRRGLDGLLFSPDDQSFSSIGSAEQQLNSFEPVTQQEAVQFTNLVSQGLLKVKSDIFRISSQGLIRAGRVVRSVESVVKRAIKREAGGPVVSTALLYSSAG